MNEMQIFNNSKFGTVRTITEDGQTLFCGSDVAKMLGYKRPNEAISAHCKGSVRRRTPTNGGAQEMLYITERDIFHLVARSNLSGADEVERWIFDEVLPMIQENTHNIPQEKVTECPEVGDLAPVKRGKTQVFNYNEIPVRTVLVDNEPWWVLADVCRVLELTSPSVVASRLDDDERAKSNLGRQGDGIIINESGLYKVILRSDKPEAKKFTRWVTHEVLPSIRKHGGYIAGQEEMTSEELLCRSILYAQSKIEDLEAKKRQLEAKIETDRPMVEFANRVTETEGSLTMEKYAKLLYDKHNLQIGRNKLFRILRALGYLQENNIPYQKYIKAGYFETCEVIKYGRPYVVTMVTGKGQVRLLEKIVSAVS